MQAALRRVLGLLAVLVALTATSLPARQCEEDEEGDRQEDLEARAKRDAALAPIGGHRALPAAAGGGTSRSSRARLCHGDLQRLPSAPALPPRRLVRLLI